MPANVPWTVVLFIVGIVGNAAVVWYRTSEHAAQIEKMSSRVDDNEKWQAGADKVLGNHEKRLDSLEDRR